MYNQYQNRVATAREAFQRAVLNYDNAITEARLQNNAALAEIAYQALQQQLELSLAGFQYKNTLLLSKAETKRTIDNTYYSRYQDVLKQINTENTLAEQIRQYNASLAENKRQHNEQMALSREQFEWQKAQAAAKSATITKSSGGSSGGSSGSSSKKKTSSKSNTKKISDAITGKKSTKDLTFTSYSQAANYMQNKGVATGDGGLMTESEWRRRKVSRSSTAEMAYTSYSDYLTNYVQWRLKNPE